MKTSYLGIVWTTVEESFEFCYIDTFIFTLLVGNRFWADFLKEEAMYYCLLRYAIRNNLGKLILTLTKVGISFSFFVLKSMFETISLILHDGVIIDIQVFVTFYEDIGEIKLSKRASDIFEKHVILLAWTNCWCDNHKPLLPWVRLFNYDFYMRRQLCSKPNTLSPMY